MDKEAGEIIKWLPVSEHSLSSYPGCGNFLCNAYVYLEKVEGSPARLCILPEEGGWLGIEEGNFNVIQGDVAPFSD